MIPAEDFLARLLAFEAGWLAAEWNPGMRYGSSRMVRHRQNILAVRDGWLPLAWAEWGLAPEDNAASQRNNRYLAQLEQAGLIERGSWRNPNGTRTTHIRITGTGREVARKSNAVTTD